MYLKRVKVRNFKSFAGATEIPFQPGFTGVAGPNGMGKSNISDAILFVLRPDEFEGASRGAPHPPLLQWGVVQEGRDGVRGLARLRQRRQAPAVRLR